MISVIQNLFLGNSPTWYKKTIVTFLVINPIALLVLNSLGMNGNFIVGWMFLLEFIFTLALALKCYPLQPPQFFISHFDNCSNNRRHHVSHNFHQNICNLYF